MLDLPELRVLLASYLDKSQLAAAAAVSKSWNESFTPVLYSKITWPWNNKNSSNNSNNNNNNNNATATNLSTTGYDTLRKYANHVRAIRINEDILSLPLDAFSRLEILVVRVSNSNDETWLRLANLIDQNRGLVEVIVLGLVMIPAEFLSHILDHPSLRKLDFTHCKFDRISTELLLDACSHLEKLKLIMTKLPRLDSLERWEQFTGMRKLSFILRNELPPQLQLEWVRKCPELRFLLWGRDDGGSDEALSVSEICKVFAHDCRFVQELRLLGWTSITDQDIGRIMDCIDRLTCIAIPSSKFGPKSFDSCTRYFSALTFIDLRHCPNFTSLMAQQILSSCPLLTEFAGTFLEARDILGISGDGGEEEEERKGEGKDEDEVVVIVEKEEEEEEEEENEETGARQTSTAITNELVVKATTTTTPATLHSPFQSWVCLNIRSLSIFICGLSGKPRAWQLRVFQQLARLEKLDYLSIGSDNTAGVKPDDGVGGLDLRLDSGLDKLKSLKRLESFRFFGLRPDMEEKEISWMLSAWPKLKVVGGEVHSLGSRRKQLEEIMNSKFKGMCCH
ncbi:hypothetical protein BGX21_007413 [Mortierella sp. AD011]|nr:hypothetical protein BGX21_007413 [Mortierella sp. AD011]